MNEHHNQQTLILGRGQREKVIQHLAHLPTIKQLALIIELHKIQHVALLKVWRNKATCIDCKRCDKACPYRLNVSTASAVRGDCVGCLECVEACPVSGTLTVNLGRPKNTGVEEKA